MASRSVKQSTREKQRGRNAKGNRRGVESDLLRRDAIGQRTEENDSSLRCVSIRMRLAQFSRDNEIRRKGHAYTCEWFKRSHCGSLWPRAAVRFRGAALPRMQMILLTNTAAPSSRKLVNWLAGMRIRRDCSGAPAAALCAPLQNRLAYQLVDKLLLAECTWRIRLNYAVCLSDGTSVSSYALFIEKRHELAIRCLQPKRKQKRSTFTSFSRF